VVVRNVAAGSLSKRLGLEEGTVLPRSIIEFYYKKDELDDPMVSEEHITAFGWATPQEIDDIMSLAIRVNDFLSGPVPRCRNPAGRLQDRVRAAVGRRDDAHRRGRRDLARLMPPVGRADQGQAGQGPLPPRHGRPGRSLPGSRRRLGILVESERPKGSGPVLVQ
jgi:phosphoribosylaminoimidazole-succinocarboxamide synthase